MKRNRCRGPVFVDATGLPGGVSRWQLPKNAPLQPRCHRLARWSLTFAARKEANYRITANPEPIFTGSNKRETPPDKPVASFEVLTAPSFSCERETPPDKPVASFEVLTAPSFSCERETPPDKPVASTKLRLTNFRKRYVLVVVFLLLAAVWTVSSSSAVAQETSPVSETEHTKILDLVFRVEDLGGKVQDLEVKETGEEIRIDLAADVLFDFDKADIRPAAQATLHQAAGIIRDRGKGIVRIEGHTDAKGNDPYNQKLSERRANSVKTWLITKEGLGNLQFVTQGFGAKKPVAPNTKPDGTDDPEGRQKNRRVEIVLKK